MASANCDSCHKAGYAAWTPAKLHASVAVTAQCATCHASAKPNTAVHSGQTVCETCHKSTSTWSGAKVDHSAFTTVTNCASCHNGTGATGKNATHMPVGTANCIACHSTTGWKPTSWNHTQLPVTGQCASCHSGAYPPADGKSASHVPYQSVASMASANCDSCHKAGYVAWTPAKVHANVTVTAQCASCHASIKPATAVHTGQTVCENCHQSTTTWSGCQGRSQHVHGSDQLRQLPQRHQRDRQERDAHPGRSDQLHRLPQHDRLEANELESHPASGHRPMRNAATAAPTRRPTARARVTSHIRPWRAWLRPTATAATRQAMSPGPRRRCTPTSR